MDETRNRRSLFAIWRWPRWTWGVVMVLMPVAYYLSLAPAVYCMAHAPAPWSAYLNDAFATFYAPAMYVADNSGVASSILQLEYKSLEAIFGATE